MSEIKFGCQTYPWKMNFSKFQGQMTHIAKVTAEAGYQGLEAEIDMLGDFFYKPERLSEILSKNKIVLAALVLHQSWAYEQETEEERLFSLQAIDFLKHFPFAKLVVSHHAGNVQRDNGNELSIKQKKLIACINSVCNMAAEEGIITCFHPNSAKNSLFRTAEDYDVLFELLNKTDIGFAPDIGHIANGDMDPLTVLKRSREKVRHIHFKDRVSQNEWTVMGEGCIDFNHIVCYLKDTRYSGWIIVEDESPKAWENADDVVTRDADYILNYKERGTKNG